MILGEEKLKEMFPEFQGDIEANGIDLRVGKAYQYIPYQISGCVDDEKNLPDTFEKEVIVEAGVEYYELEEGESMFFEIDRPISIPENHVQLYYLRSTFVRCGLVLASAVGDAGFQGTLMMTVHNPTKHSILIGANERLVQAVTYTAEGCGVYNGSYQNDKAYKE